MAERLAALGLRAPAKSGETAQQRQEREKKERDERRRQAEEEDSRREQERQRRLADESIAPPSPEKTAGKKPPPPPSRKMKADNAQNGVKPGQTEVKVDDPLLPLPAWGAAPSGQGLRNEQANAEAETRQLELVTNYNLCNPDC